MNIFVKINVKELDMETMHSPITMVMAKYYIYVCKYLNNA